ncbi:hypothetical protein J3459_006663 [Metarhizium acridum]|nr:hypothetical protein J3459_006663 [Metarhizium acridum]
MSGPWVFDLARKLSTFHEKLAQDFGSIDGQFQIVNIFPHRSESGNYESVVGKFATTCGRDDEIQIGVDKSHWGIDESGVPELVKIARDLLEDARTR